MKVKPNTEQFKPKKDPSAFLEGGAADIADRTGTQSGAGTFSQKSPDQPAVKTKARAKDNRQQKVFRLPPELIKALKRESYERSTETGTRITETDLVEQALRNLLKA